MWQAAAVNVSQMGIRGGKAPCSCHKPEDLFSYAASTAGWAAHTAFNLNMGFVCVCAVASMKTKAGDIPLLGNNINCRLPIWTLHVGLQLKGLARATYDLG